jgi:uncharacterized phage protein gp47/JayE
LFEDRTYEKIMDECLAAAPKGIDVRQGSIFYDAVAAACFKITQYYADLRNAFDLVFITTAVDEYLDRRGAEYNVFRNSATRATYKFVFSGTGPLVGNRFFHNGLYFILRYRENNDGTNVFYLEAEEPGIAGNNIVNGTAAIPLDNISGLESARFGDLLEPGTDTENDDSYRRRIQEKIAGPAENGNRQHYKTWCESVDGVGCARIISHFAGKNTVMGVIIGANGEPGTDELVKRVQDYVDPITKNVKIIFDGKEYTVGDGLGNGVSNIGAHFLAKAAEKVSINIDFTAIADINFNKDGIKESAKKVLEAYFYDLTLKTPENETVIIQKSIIGAILLSLPGLRDYNNLNLDCYINEETQDSSGKEEVFDGNGKKEIAKDEFGNIKLNDEQVAVIGEVSIN